MFSSDTQPAFRKAIRTPTRFTFPIAGKGSHAEEGQQKGSHADESPTAGESHADLVLSASMYKVVDPMRDHLGMITWVFARGGPVPAHPPPS